MERQLSTSTLKSTPVLNLKGAKKGSFFTGVIKDYKSHKNGFVNEKGEPNFDHIYNLFLEETDMEIVVKSGTEYVPAKVLPGDVIGVFAPTKLHIALQQAKSGEKVKFVALGKGKANSRGGRAYEFEVKVIE